MNRALTSKISRHVARVVPFELIPLGLFVAFGCSVGVGVAARKLMFCPDVVVNHKQGHQPWHRFGTPSQRQLHEEMFPSPASQAREDPNDAKLIFQPDGLEKLNFRKVAGQVQENIAPTRVEPTHLRRLHARAQLEWA